MRFIVFFLFAQIFGVEVDVEPKKYMFSQQMSEVCFLSCWHNHKYIQVRRDTDGCLLDESGKFLHVENAKTRVEWFLDTSLPFAQWYVAFRNAKNSVHFPQFLARVKATGVSVQDGQEYLETLDPISQLTGKYYFPHLLSEDESALHANNLCFPVLLKTVQDALF